MSEGQVDTGRITHLPQMHRDVAWKSPVRVATTANGTLASAFEAGDTVDGVTLAENDRLLIKDQTAAEENGIYVVQASGVPFRVFDMDNPSEVPGAVVLVLAGTANAGQLYFTDSEPAVLDDDAIDWQQFTGADLTGLVAKADDRSVNILCDGGGSVVSTGVKAYFQMPNSGHFRAAKIISKDASSSAVFDVWVRSGNVPTAAQSITASAKPTLTSAQLADPACTIASWSSTAFSANDWVGINLDSVTTATLLTLVLYIDWT